MQERKETHAEQAKGLAGLGTRYAGEKDDPAWGAAFMWKRRTSRPGPALCLAAGLLLLGLAGLGCWGLAKGLSWAKKTKITSLEPFKQKGIDKNKIKINNKKD